MDSMIDPRESKKSIRHVVVIREIILEAQLIQIDYQSIREPAAININHYQVVVKTVRIKRRSMVNEAAQSKRVKEFLSQSRIHARNQVHEKGWLVTQALRTISFFSKVSQTSQTRDLVCIYQSLNIKIQSKNLIKKSHLSKFLTIALITIRRVRNLSKMFQMKERQAVIQSKLIL